MSPATEVFRELDRVVEAAGPAERPGLALALTARLGALAAGMAADSPVEPETQPAGEHLLTPEQAVAIIGGGVGRGWLFRNTQGLRFRRGLSRKCIRFEEAGLRRWLSARAAVRRG